MISRFRDEHFFLSSMYPLSNGVEMQDGRIVSAVEIGYHADKYVDTQARELILASKDGFAAKRKSRDLRDAGVAERTNWKQDKLHVMRWYVWQKFGRNEPEATMLTETSPQLLVEGNTWKDDYWGAVNSDGALLGRNNLGLLLMQARGLLIDDVDLVQDAYRNVELESGETRDWLAVEAGV